MPKNRKPRSPGRSQGPRPKLSRRAILSGLGIGLVARRLRAGGESPSGTSDETKPPAWVESLARCTSKYIEQPGWNEKKEYRELKLLTLRMNEIKSHDAITVSRDPATPLPAYQPKPGGKKS